jgi:hypothetical protein
MTDSTVIAIVGIGVGAIAPIVTLAVKGLIDSRMESKRALLSLRATLYGRRLDVIASLYSDLRDVETLFQQIARPFMFAGEPPRHETEALAIKTYHGFAFQFLKKRVLLPASLASKTEALVKAIWEASLKYSSATDAALPDGQSRADDFNAVRQIVQDRLPVLLSQFEEECREILEPRKTAA